MNPIEGRDPTQIPELETEPTLHNPEDEKQPLVGLIMGSKSDLSVMAESADILEELGVRFEVRIISAHRTPDLMVEYAKSAHERGLKVIIAGAGGAAHLPGMTAAHTELPVIGVPIESKSLKGQDSLYSVVQMPKGVPVATVAINGAENAGVLAAEILATFDENIAYIVREYRLKLGDKVAGNDAELERKGYRRYLMDIEDGKDES